MSLSFRTKTATWSAALLAWVEAYANRVAVVSSVEALPAIRASNQSRSWKSHAPRKAPRRGPDIEPSIP